ESASAGTRKLLFGSTPERGELGGTSGGPGRQTGWHEYQISPDGALAIHTSSSFDEPPVVELVRLSNHDVVRVLVDNGKLRERYAAVAKGRNEFFEVEAGPGLKLDGWAMYPANFDATKSWP